MLLYVIARAANPIATARLPNAMIVITRDVHNVASATTRNTAAAIAHMTAGFFVGGAACFDNAISCRGLRSEFVGRPV